MRFAPFRPLVLALALAGAPVLASADPAPTVAQRAAVERALQAQGFVEWEHLELDDGRIWEVEGAVGLDGHKYDLKVSAITLDVVERDPVD